MHKAREFRAERAEGQQSVARVRYEHLSESQCHLHFAITLLLLLLFIALI